MDDLDSLLADLEATSAHLCRPPVLLTDPPSRGATRSPPGGDPPARPPPPPYGPDAGGDTEQLYRRGDPPAPPPAPSGLGELDRLLRDLDVTHGSITDELLAQRPAPQGPEGAKKKEDEVKVGESPPRSAGPPASATSATQELDKLMASLSDFHPRPTAPPKKGVPQEGEGKLEEMLELLQEELGRRGVPTATPPHPPALCGGCHQPIVGKALQALGRSWHPEHWVCGGCGGALGGGPFLARDGVPLCPPDYRRLCCPPCARCHRPLLGKVVTALGKTWHPEHFCCAKCGRPLGEEGFLERDGQPYCREDFAELFSSRCQGCGQPILETFVAALQGLWHPQCFVCRECLAPFPGGTFYEEGGHPYCERHAGGARGAGQRCGGCGETIDGSCVTALGQRFHPHHFVCAFCRRALAKTTFQEQEGKAYCPPCFRRLFG